MNSTLGIFLLATGAVTLAEMGDKTQLLAMAFATRIKASKVMIGVFLATVLNHALAVAVGNLITRFSSIQVWIQGVAALSFIFFGLWTIRGDKLEGEDQRKSRFGAVMTVAIAFFIAELGDKTQLATIALAARLPGNPLAILAGTTTGMLIADGIGIVVGVVLCKRIPERTIKLISAAAFVVFGLVAVYQVTSSDLGLTLPVSLAIVGVLLAITAILATILIRKDKAQAEVAAVAEYCRIKEAFEHADGTDGLEVGTKIDS
ncbi:MAG: hypothetical protein H6Q62_293 [Firmicutes bacterium]|nr:hypothetical protein [Bacillota bacterium]